MFTACGKCRTIVAWPACGNCRIPSVPHKMSWVKQDEANGSERRFSSFFSGLKDPVHRMLQTYILVDQEYTFHLYCIGSLGLILCQWKCVLGVCFLRQGCSSVAELMVCTYHLS